MISYLLDKVFEFVLKPTIETFAKKIPDLITRLSTKLKLGVLLISISLIVVVLNYQLLHSVALVVANNSKSVPLSKKNRTQYNQIIHELEQKMIISKSQIGGARYESWPIAQQVIAGEKDILKSIKIDGYLSYQKKQKNDQFNGWEHGGSIHIAATAYIIQSYYQLKIATDTLAIKNLLDYQLKNGAWALRQTQNKNYSSTFATCQVLMALFYAKEDPSTGSYLKERIEDAIRLGTSWINIVYDKNLKGWKDYPHMDKGGKNNRSLSAYCIYTLSLINKEVDLLRVPNWLNHLYSNIDKKNFFERTNVILDIKGEAIKEETRYYFVPWISLCLNKIYQDLDFVLKVKATLMINYSLPVFDFYLESDVHEPWIFSEYLRGIKPFQK